MMIAEVRESVRARRDKHFIVKRMDRTIVYVKMDK